MWGDSETTEKRNIVVLMSGSWRSDAKAVCDMVASAQVFLGRCQLSSDLSLATFTASSRLVAGKMLGAMA